MDRVKAKTEAKGNEYSLRIMKDISDLQQKAINSLGSGSTFGSGLGLN